MMPWTPTMDIVLALNDDYFCCAREISACAFVSWTLDHRRFRTGKMRREYRLDAKKRGNPRFGEFRAMIGLGTRGKHKTRLRNYW